MAAIYTVFTSPHHAPMPNHLPTLIVTPHGQPNQILYTYLHTEDNRVNYLLTPSPQGDLCVAKLFPPSRGGSTAASASSSSSQVVKNNVVRCEASRDLRWTIENTGVMSPIYKIINQDDTPLYQISKPNPNAEFWTMFYFKYAGHQIPPKRIEFGKVAKNPPEKGGGTRITITGKSEDEKQVWQTLGVGNEDCVEWVVCCACLNLLDDQILQAAERKNGTSSSSPATSQPISNSAPASSRPSPASTSLRPNVLQRPSNSSAISSGGGGGRSPMAGIASTSGSGSNSPGPGLGQGSGAITNVNGNLNLAATYRNGPAANRPIPQQQQQPPPVGYRPDPRSDPRAGGMGVNAQQRGGVGSPGYDPRYGNGGRGGVPGGRSAPAPGRAPPAGLGRRF